MDKRCDLHSQLHRLWDSHSKSSKGHLSQLIQRLIKKYQTRVWSPGDGEKRSNNVEAVPVIGYPLLWTAWAEFDPAKEEMDKHLQ